MSGALICYFCVFFFFLGGGGGNFLRQHKDDTLPKFPEDPGTVSGQSLIYVFFVDWPLSFPHEDGNGEKLTVKKWWLFGCRFFHGL